MNRLITASGGGINSQYHYDGDSNRIKQIVPAGTYQYPNDTATTLPVVLNKSGPDGSIDYLSGISMISKLRVPILVRFAKAANGLPRDESRARFFIIAGHVQALVQRGVSTAPWQIALHRMPRPT